MPDRKTSIARQIANLEKMKTPELKKRWLTLFATEPPGYNRVLLLKRLAYRIQELAYGGLSHDTRERMDNLLKEHGFDEIGRKGKKISKSRINRPVAGTRLIREWDGVNHEVIVLTDGFEYQQKPYKSLSAIAREITGTRWNGPMFFGLRKVGSANVQVEQSHV